jgi:hypothetical protein
MNKSIVIIILSLVTGILLVACQRPGEIRGAIIRQTSFPGQITAGGLSSGEVLAHKVKPETDGKYSGGTPFHGGGAEGNSGGTATAGSVQESGHGPVGSSKPSENATPKIK